MRLGDGWRAGTEGDYFDKNWLTDGVFPSMVLVPAQSRSKRLAAKARWAPCIRMVASGDDTAGTQRGYEQPVGTVPPGKNFVTYYSNSTARR